MAAPRVRHSVFSKVFVVVFLLLAGAPAPSGAEGAPELIEAGVSENYIHIEPNFDGANIVLFGAVDRRHLKDDGVDLAITIRGPSKPMTVWKKERQAGLWINSAGMTLDSVPSFYAVLTTKPIADLAPLEERAKYGIGLDALELPAANGATPSSELGEYREALIRVKHASRLFLEDSGAIEFLGRSLFRAKTFLPAAAGPGRYRAKIFLLQDKKVIGATSSAIRLEKIGLESFLSTTSTSHPWIYGVFAVLLASAIGGSASLIFRKG